MIKFKAFVFEGKKTGKKVLNDLDKFTLAHRWIDDVALVQKNKHGSIRVDSTWAQNDSDIPGGIAYGAITGALIGALVGPAGAAAGAMMGGSTGGFIAVGANLEIEDPILSEFAMSLKNDTSAIVLVASDEYINEFSHGLKNVEGTIYETEINEKDVDSIRKALKGTVGK